jgi:hypothetical protein
MRGYLVDLLYSNFGQFPAINLPIGLYVAQLCRQPADRAVRRCLCGLVLNYLHRMTGLRHCSSRSLRVYSPYQPRVWLIHSRPTPTPTIVARNGFLVETFQRPNPHP